MIGISVKLTPAAPAPQETRQLYRVKTDLQNGLTLDHRANGWTYDDGTQFNMLPPVYPMRARKDTGNIAENSGEVRVKLAQRWLDEIARINTPKAADYILKPDTCFFSDPISVGYLPLLLSGNAIEIVRKEISNGVEWGEVSLYANDSLPAGHTYDTDPLRIHRLTILRRDLITLTNPPIGVDHSPAVAHMPMVGYAAQPLYIATHWLDPFPALPMTVRTMDGVSHTLVKYDLRGSSVFGWDADGRRLTLYDAATGTHPTTWRMETPPPPEA